MSTVWPLYWCQVDQKAATPWGLLPPTPGRQSEAGASVVEYMSVTGVQAVEGCKKMVVQVKIKTGNASVEFISLV